MMSPRFSPPPRGRDHVVHPLDGHEEISIRAPARATSVAMQEAVRFLPEIKAETKAQ